MMYRGTFDNKVSFDTKEELYAYQQGRVDMQNEIIKALAEYNTRNMGNAEIFGFDIARGIVEKIT